MIDLGEDLILQLINVGFYQDYAYDYSQIEELLKEVNRRKRRD